MYMCTLIYAYLAGFNFFSFLVLVKKNGLNISFQCAILSLFFYSPSDDGGQCIMYLIAFPIPSLLEQYCVQQLLLIRQRYFLQFIISIKYWSLLRCKFSHKNAFRHVNYIRFARSSPAMKPCKKRFITYSMFYIHFIYKFKENNRSSHGNWKKVFQSP